MRMINCSYKIGCLSCTFTEKELSEYLQNKKRASQISRKNAVQSIGQQNDTTWVLAENVHLSSLGEVIPSSESNYMWLGSLYSGPGVPDASNQCMITLPLSTSPLQSLLERLAARLQHNFYPAVLLMGSTVLALHYKQFIAKLKYCPIPLAVGESGTGKSTALESAFSVLGACKSRMYSKVTREKIFSMCCNNGVPLGVDDPHSQSDISKLLVELYNGYKSATVAKGDQTPSTTAVVSANFSPIDQKRLVIHFI